jgi:bifunctional non-homologous end joining protein LigD
VIIWDEGTYEPIGDMAEGLAAGAISFYLLGRKLVGTFSLVRLKKGSGKEWLLIKR